MILGVGGILILSMSGVKGGGAWVLILFCIFIIIYGYLSTGRWGQYFTGIEDKPEKPDGTFGSFENG